MRNIIIFTSLLTLVGCSTTPPIKSYEGKVEMREPSLVTMKDDWDQQKQQLEKLTNWKVEGRFAASKGKQGTNASFVWEQKNEFYNIKLFGPFGAGSAHLTGNAKQVVLDDADGKRHIAKTPEALIHQTMGLAIPLRGLKYWIKGIPSPLAKVDHLEVNKNSKLTRLKQDGWLIEYARYSQVGSRSLPKKMVLTNRDLKVKLVVQSWYA